MDLIEQAKDRLRTYRAVAEYLGIDETMVSQIRKKRRPMPPYHAARLAELLEQNPAQAFVEAEIIAAGKNEAANLRRWFRGVAACIVVAAVVAGHSGLWTYRTLPSQASTASVRARRRHERLARLFNASKSKTWAIGARAQRKLRR